MAKKNHIKPVSSSEDDDEMETEEEEEEEDDSSSSGEEVDQLMDPIKITFGMNLQAASGSETESDPETGTVNDKEKKICGSGEAPASKKVLIDGDWFEKSDLVRSISSLGVNEENVKQRWSKVPMKKKKKIANKWEKLEIEGFKFVSRKAHLLHEAMSAMAEAATT